MKTETEIETLLRNAPAPQPSPELGTKLRNAVRLPPSSNGADLNLGVPFWRRWLPAIGYAVMILGCVVVLAVQNQQNNAAIRDLEELREEVALKEKQVEQQREQTRLALAADARIKNLQDNAAEADQLALTLEELRALIARLTAEAAELEAQLAEMPERNEIIAPYDFFNDPDGPMQKAREEAHSIKCVNNMKQIGLSFRVHAQDNDGWYPPNLNSVSNELIRATVLCCPKDVANTKLAETLFGSIQRTEDGKSYYRALNSAWARWPVNGGSYDVFLSQLPHEPYNNTPEAVVARCRFHGHVTMADGSVQRGDTAGGLQP